MESLATSPTDKDWVSIAVIVPTWQEAATLPALLRSLQQQTTLPDQIIVADAGSTDGTIAVAEQAAVTVVHCPQRGRGCQIAYALNHCAQDVLLIAHADMRFPPEALQQLRAQLQAHPEVVGGCFGHCLDHPGLVYRLIEWADRRRAQRGLAYGDQAQFFRRTALSPMGGFPAWPLFEDVALSLRLQRIGPLLYLNLPVTVSTRRFQRLGLLRTLWRNWRLRRQFGRYGAAVVRELYRRYYAGPTDDVPPAEANINAPDAPDEEPLSRGHSETSQRLYPSTPAGSARAIK
jgi:rSAM/selenodomain-associated transferase 2